MKLTNPIGWCDATGNAVIGCDKVSPGCLNCYAEGCTPARVLRAAGVETWGKRGVRHPVAGFTAKLARLNKLCVCDTCGETYPFKHIGRICGAPLPGDPFREPGCTGRVRRIRFFADSNSDWLDRRWTAATLAAALDTIRLAPNVDTLLLTKRPEMFKDRLVDAIQASWGNGDDARRCWLSDWFHGKAPAHVWLGVSAEDQLRADQRIPALLRIPAAVRFISAEPLLEAVDLRLQEKWCSRTEMAHDCDTVSTHLRWVIVGGESGKKRRDCGLDALRFVARQCLDTGVPLYMKQDCAPRSGQQGRISDDLWQIKDFPEVAK